MKIFFNDNYNHRFHQRQSKPVFMWNGIVNRFKNDKSMRWNEHNNSFPNWSDMKLPSCFHHHQIFHIDCFTGFTRNGKDLFPLWIITIQCDCCAWERKNICFIEIWISFDNFEIKSVNGINNVIFDTTNKNEFRWKQN